MNSRKPVSPLPLDEALKKAHADLANVADLVQKGFREIATEQARIHQKVQNGSRLTTSRFTSRLPVR